MSLLAVNFDLSPALGRLLSQPAAVVKRASILAAKRAAEVYVDAMHEYIRAGRAYTPRPPVAGQTIEQGLGWHAQGDGAVIYSQTPHGVYVEFDTRPHLIAPRPGRKALRWFGGGPGGGMLIRRVVHHPGTKAQPFFFADQPARQARMLAAATEAVAEVLGNV
ncbi:hypothetical protein [uncultured Thiodictyon sp.]|uniref:hypothetical protein n=1 Tax=uncultured Thiodictyon sp. TaxID=1846217 RepID=UPI0025F3E422|nr:hypothetical protein [uncultured Thiodictyon sp.]